LNGAPANPPPARTRLSGTAVFGFICILGSVLVLCPASLFVPVAFARASSVTSIETAKPSVEPANQPIGVETVPSERAAGEAAPQPVKTRAVATGGGVAWAAVACFATLPVALTLVGTILGWIAFAQIRASRGMLRGQGLALFDGLFYPVIFGSFAIFIAPLTALVLVVIAAAIAAGIYYLNTRTPSQA
jgi:hypothetical protein